MNQRASRRSRWRALLGVLSLSLLLGAGCTDGDGTGAGAREVVVYTALDRGFSEPIFLEFTGGFT